MDSGMPEPLFDLEHLVTPDSASAAAAGSPAEPTTIRETGGTTTGPGTTRGERNEARESIRYVVEVALRYGKMGTLPQLLDRVAGFHQYKPFNALLALLQRPAATYCLPAHQWEEKYGRIIRPDEQPLVLLQPRGPVMFLFDVSQTEEGPECRGELPAALRNPYAMRNAAKAPEWLACTIENAKADGIRVLNPGLGHDFAGCAQRTRASVTQVVVTNRRTQTRTEVKVHFDLMLNRSYNPTEQLATLAHELGHVYCGHLGAQESQLLPGEEYWPDRSTLDHGHRELEAESVARVVFRRLLPDIQLPDHLSQYFMVEPELSAMDLELVLTAAGRILEMTEGHAPRRSRRSNSPG